MSAETDTQVQSKELEVHRQWAKRVADVCTRAAAGDLEARLLGCQEEGDLGRMVQGINNLLDLTDAFVRESKAALAAAGDGRFYRRVLLRGMRGTFKSTSRNINEATDQMHRQAEQLKEAERRRHELADQLESRVKDVSSRVSTSAGELRLTAEALAGSASKTTTLGSEVALVSSETADGVQTLASATEQLNAEVGEVEKRTRDSSATADEAVETVTATKDAMAELNEASQRVGRVVKLISQIAGQTNLLALNATIEAARSGEAGKGFAVVASEVKNLARQTSEATEEITAEIKAIQTKTEQVDDSVATIASTIGRISESARSIADSVDQQRAATLEISRTGQQAAAGASKTSEAISAVNQEAQEAHRNANQLLQSADLLAADSETLENAVDAFAAEIRGGGA